MNNILKSISCVLLVMFTLCSCISYNVHDENGNNFYKDMNRAIEYSYPSGWSLESRSGDAYFYIRPDKCDTAVEPFIVVSLVYNNSIDTHQSLEAYADELNENLSNVKVTDSGEGTDSRKNKYRYYKYTYTDENGTEMYSTDRFVFLGELLTVLVSGKCSADDIETYDSSFNVTLESMTYFS